MFKKIHSIALWKKILVGVLIGLAVGFAAPNVASALKPIGDIFLRLLKMLIVPLVLFSIISGVCKMGDIKQLRVVGLRYVLWIVLSAVCASLLGVGVGLITQLGRGNTDFLNAAEAIEAGEYSFINTVIGWFPTNIVESMSTANMLQIIIFCLFFGVALLALGEKASSVVKFVNECNLVMLKLTEYVMELAPIGIASLIATMVSTVSGAMMKDILTLIVADNIVCFGILFLYPVAARVIAGLNLKTMVRKLMPTAIVALSTTSSAATLPVSMKVAKENFGISENIFGFTLPLGNTCGMTGLATLIGLLSVFIYNLYGLDITFASVLEFVFLGLILSIGAAGVKGAGAIMCGVLLTSFGVPTAMLAIITAIYPVIDPCQTCINNVGDVTGTAIIAKKLNKMDMDVFNS